MTTNRKIGLFLELVLLFVLLPILFLFDLITGFWNFIPIGAFFGYTLTILFRQNALSAKDFTFKNTAKSMWWKMLFFPILLFGGLLIWTPDQLWADFTNPRIVFAIVCYPLFSSLPQELIYRKFFFFRYEHLFANRFLLILTNAALFSIAHLYFMNWVALLLTFIGGIAFSISYLKTKSVAYVTIEHSVYGLALLLTYMNQFFYKAF